MNFKNYSIEIENALEKKYSNLVDYIYAKKIAHDLSLCKTPQEIYTNNCSDINRYYKSPEKGKEIFEDVFSYMSINE